MYLNAFIAAGHETQSMRRTLRAMTEGVLSISGMVYADEILWPLTRTLPITARHDDGRAHLDSFGRTPFLTRHSAAVQRQHVLKTGW